jgi:RNA polymerase sigma-70 factor, ECF subfamily
MVKKKIFASWVKDYHDRIYKVIFHIVGNQDDALDCTQEVFLKAYKKRNAFRGESSPYTWLRSIAVHHAINFVTRNKMRYWKEYHEYEHTDSKQTEETAPRVFQREWLLHLTEMERRVVESRIYEKRSFRETAEKLNTTENSAKVLYHKAIKKLQQVVQ